MSGSNALPASLIEAFRLCVRKFQWLHLLSRRHVRGLLRGGKCQGVQLPGKHLMLGRSRIASKGWLLIRACFALGSLDHGVAGARSASNAVRVLLFRFTYCHRTSLQMLGNIASPAPAPLPGHPPIASASKTAVTRSTFSLLLFVEPQEPPPSKAPARGPTFQDSSPRFQPNSKVREPDLYNQARVPIKDWPTP